MSFAPKFYRIITKEGLVLGKNQLTLIQKYSADRTPCQPPENPCGFEKCKKKVAACPSLPERSPEEEVETCPEEPVFTDRIECKERQVEEDCKVCAQVPKRSGEVDKKDNPLSCCKKPTWNK